MKSYSGIGLRHPHYSAVLAGESKVGWFEVISENFMDTEGRPLHILEKVRENFPIGTHGVSLNIGSPDPINLPYLKKLKALIKRIEPYVVSDHLCWGGTEGKNWHDLLPLPMTEHTIEHVVQKIKQVQDILGQRIALENISTYLLFKEDEMPEWEFTKRIIEEADCYLLLDVNNIYVNSFNHGFDAKNFVREIPAYRVVQYHLAGHSNLETFLFDTHDHEIIDPVWELFEFTVNQIGPRPFIIERDDHIPELNVIEAEARRAEQIIEKVIKPSRGRNEQAELSVHQSV
ncbi:MAG: hypothetical protein JWQ35_772 [Bacteriovoracaceae bacterium]|nr:hypothetical protein [Bacteriovoracaceae bacterium]